MISGNDLVMLSAQICICRSYYEDACRKVKAHFDSNAELTMPQLRDILNTSRKYALALLEYYEKNKMLKREGDNRRPGSEFESLCDWKDQIT